MMTSKIFTDKKRNISVFLSLTAVFTAFDQLTKYLAQRNLKGGTPIVLIKNVLELHYLENQGAAWGMFRGYRTLLLLFTAAAIFVITKCYCHLSNEKKYDLLHILFILVTAGAIGNGIDRLFHGYVIDFIYFSCIRFPVFNIADCFVTVPVFLGLLLYRKEWMEWMKNG